MTKVTKPADYILITEVKPDSQQLKQAVDIWKQIYSINNNENRSLYISDKNDSILEISAVNSLANFNLLLSSKQQLELEAKLKTILVSDWKRQILSLKNVVKSQKSSVPLTPYLQLRHIEVPLQIYEEYLQWREKTIFEHVRKQTVIDSFLAYHSILSTEPGVMFLSGFQGDVDSYMNGFKSAEYQAIVRQAGNKYIAGGEKGLFTVLYRKV